MTSRERVLKAIRHEQPDRVPIDFGAMRSTGIMAVAYNKLKQHLGIAEGETRVFDTMQQLAEIEKPILDRFHVDVVDAGNTFGREPGAWKPWTLPDGSSAYIPLGFNPESDGEGGFVVKDASGTVISRAPKGCLYFEPMHRPLAHVTSMSELEDWQPGLVSPEHLEPLRQRAKWLYENTEYALLVGFGGNILEGGQGLRGWGQFMMDMAIEPEFAHTMLDKLTDAHMKNVEVFLDAVGEFVQVIQMGDDLGTQSATQVSVPMYREFIHPRHKRIYQYVRENYPNVHVFLHSCGSIYDFMPDIVDEGVEILNPVQTSAAKMDPATLKAEFGGKITFWGGGCDTQAILSNATPAEIDAHVKERMAILRPGGGFVFNQIHNVQSNVPPENVVAMLDAAYRYGEY